MSDDRTPGDGSSGQGGHGPGGSGRPPSGPPPGWGPPPGQGPQQGPGQQGPWGPPQGPWGQPQGPQGQQSWGPPQQGPGQQGQYGAPAWGQQPGQQPGWGQQPGQQPGWGAPGPGPSGPSGGSSKKLWIVVGAGVAAVVLLIGAVVVGVTQLGGGDDDEAGPSDDPTSSESTEDAPEDDGPLSAGAADELRETLEGQDWTCYDSLDEPVVVKRCFITKPGDGEYSSPVRGQLTMQYQDDAVGSARFRVSGATGASAIAPLVEATATAMGDTLFDGKGSDLATLATQQSSDAQEIDGARVTGNGAGVDVYGEDFDFEQPESPALPSTADAQGTLTSAGYTCKTENEIFSCEGSKDRIRLRTSAATSGSIGWSVTISPADYDGGVTIQQGLTAASELLKSLQVVDDEGAAWIAGDPADGSTADIGGHELSIIRSEVGDGDIFNAIVSVRPIR